MYEPLPPSYGNSSLHIGMDVRYHLPVNWQTDWQMDMTENITLPQNKYAGDKYMSILIHIVLKFGHWQNTAEFFPVSISV